MADLQPYRAKRNFRRTKEPKGDSAPVASGGAGGLFVMHKHAARRLHYDLRLEHDGVLWSWAVTRGPSLDPSERRLAVHVEDHPLDYGSFEGTIAKGEYGAGAVIVWDEGSWTPQEDPAKGLAKGHLKFEITGRKLRGAWHLVRLKPRGREKRDNWLLIKVDDAHADPTRNILDEQPESVRSGRTIDDIEAQGSRRTRKKATAAPDTAAPHFIPPCLARLQQRPPEGPAWIYEVKFDGYRIQAHIADKKATLLTRAGLDWTGKFGKPIRERLGALDCRSAILDGEVVVLDRNGVSSFSGLQLALSEQDTEAMVYYVFDLLERDGIDLRGRRLLERKKQLHALLEGGENGAVRYSEHFDVPGRKILEHACRMGLEGIVAKNGEAAYRSGRGQDWIKSKCTLRQEFVIAGYLPSEKTGRGIRSLVVATYEGGELRSAGNVGTGFSARLAGDLKRKLDQRKVSGPTIAGQGANQKGVVWVRPELVAEIEFRSWTRGGSIRHASFQGLREDKPAAEVIDEAAKPADAIGAVTRRSRQLPTTRVKLTNPDKLLWPREAVSKRALLDFYMLAWPRMEPFVVDRPLALLRAPDGIEHQRFFQKHAMAGMNESIVTTPDPADQEDVLTIRDFDGLAALVQLGVVEIHVWGARIDPIEKPDQIVFDLDPDEGLGPDDVCAATLEIRDRLSELGFSAFVKTSGGKGFHVVIPLQPKAEWEQVKEFAHDFARAMAQTAPQRYTAALAKKARKGRIFIDYLRNGRGSTTVAPWSSRAKAGATVSVPVSWAMVEAGISPAAFAINGSTTLQQLDNDDPWADFFHNAKPLARRQGS